jgi:hypothetical protein
VAWIDQVIFAIDVIYIHVIVVIIPVGRPRFGVLEIIAAVIKAAILAAPHVEMMFAPQTAAELFVRNTPAATALVVLFGLLGTLLVLRTILLLCWSGLVISIVLILLFGAIPFPIAIVVSRSIILLRLVVLSRSIIFLRPAILLRSIVFLGAVLLRPIVLPRLIALSCSIVLARTIVLLARTIILLSAISILLLSIRFLLGAVGRFFLVLLASVGLLSLSWLFLPFRFLLRLIFIGLLSREAGCADKENHHRGTKDEFHFDSSVSSFSRTLSQAYVVGKTTGTGLAGIVTSSMATGEVR